MNNPIKLTEDIFAVVVPKDAKEFTIVDLSKERKALNYIIEEYGGYSGCFKDIPNYNLELLGEVTADSISFDVEPYVDQNEFDVESYDGIFVATLRFWDYVEESFDLFDKDESFYSLLQSNGIYFVNLIEKPNYKEYNSGKEYDKNYEEAFEKWQEAESKVIKGKLIFLKPI